MTGNSTPIGFVVAKRRVRTTQSPGLEMPATERVGDRVAVAAVGANEGWLSVLMPESSSPTVMPSPM